MDTLKTKNFYKASVIILQLKIKFKNSIKQKKNGEKTKQSQKKLKELGKIFTSHITKSYYPS